MTKRIYSEKEVAELLKRTAKLQKTSHPHSGAGLTLDELELVAAEAGLDPRHLRAAADEMERQPEDGQLLLSSDNTKTHNRVDRWIAGPITDDAWDDLVAMLRYQYDTDLGRAMGMPMYGTSSAENNGRTREWRHTSMSGIETRLLVRPAADGNRMQMSQRVGWGSTAMESGLYGSLIAFVIAGIAAAVGGPIAAIIAFIVSLVGAIALVHFLDTAWRKKKNGQLETLAGKVVETLEAKVKQPELYSERTTDVAPPQPYKPIQKTVASDTARSIENRRGSAPESDLLSDSHGRLDDSGSRDASDRRRDRS